MVPRRAASAVLLAALLACAGSGPAFGKSEAETRAEAAEPLPTHAVELLPVEIELMGLVSEYRADHGLPPLRVNAALCRASRKHAGNMASQDRLSHVLDGEGPTERALAEGFAGPVAENCAAGRQGTPRSFFDLWVASDAHRGNMLSPGSGELGVGFARTEKEGMVYCAAMFGAARRGRSHGANEEGVSSAER